MNLYLPTSVEVNGTQREIRYDFRATLEICVALSDPELTDQDRAEAALIMFYPGFDDFPREDYEEAIKKCFWFINAGKEEGEKPGPRLMDWEQDIDLIVPPVNRLAGKDIRGMDYLHWWTFLSWFNEIGGDCTFAHVVGMRDKLARHKTLDKADKEWLRRNRDIVDFKRKYTEADDDIISRWT